MYTLSLENWNNYINFFQPIDSKREEFRKYLEKSGAMDALTKVLVMLYDEPEKPADALEYPLVLMYIGICIGSTSK